MRYLFEKKRQLRLTRAGKQFLGYVTQILQLCDAAKHSLHDNPVEGGVLVLGCVETFADIYVPTILKHYRQCFPKMTINLKLGQTASLLEQMRHNQLDCAFGGALIDPESWQIEPLLRGDLCLFTAKTVADIQKMSDCTLITFPVGCSIRGQTEAFLRHQGVADYNIMEFNAMSTVLECVKAGLGIACLPSFVARHLPNKAEFHIKPLPKQFNRSDINLITQPVNGKTNMINSLLASAKHIVTKLT